MFVPWIGLACKLASRRHEDGVRGTFNRARTLKIKRRHAQSICNSRNAVRLNSRLIGSYRQNEDSCCRAAAVEALLRHCCRSTSTYTLQNATYRIRDRILHDFQTVKPYDLYALPYRPSRDPYLLCHRPANAHELREEVLLALSTEHAHPPSSNVERRAIDEASSSAAGGGRSPPPSHADRGAHKRPQLRSREHGHRAGLVC